jgi:hypothetical protein
MDEPNRSWLLVSRNPDRWINIATARGLDVSSDGTSKLWWISNAAPALLNREETRTVLAAIGPFPLEGSPDGALPFPEPSPPSPLSQGGEGELDGRLRRPRRRAG